MKKDVLFLCQFFYPEYISSAMLPFQTAESLKKAGYKVDVLCGYPKEYLENGNKLPKQEVVEGIKITRRKYIQLGRKNFFSRLINYFSFTFVMFLNLPVFRKYKVIIVYSNPPILPLIPILAKKMFGCKIVFVAYDLYPEIAIRTSVLGQNSVISKVMRTINKLLYKNVAKVVALSTEMKDFIVSDRNITEERIEVIPNWATESYEVKEIKSNTFRDLRERYDLIVSYFGNMGTAQDMETIIQTIKNSSIKKENIAFFFAGHGNKKSKLESEIQNNKLENCYLFDYLTGTDFTDALSVTDLFIVSLQQNISGLAVPSKTYSYYQAQEPVIAIMDKATDISKEIEKYNAGISIENGNSEILVENLINLRHQNIILTEMKNNVSRLYQEKYKKEYQLKKYKKIIVEILEEF